MALTTLQKDAILSNLPSVFANEEGRLKLAEYIIAGEISWEEIEETGSLSASQIAELRLIVNSKKENSFWAYVSQEDSIEAYQQYLDQYPTGKYVNIAKICMKSCGTTSSIRSTERFYNLLRKTPSITSITHGDGGTTYIPKTHPKATALHSTDIENNLRTLANRLESHTYNLFTEEQETTNSMNASFSFEKLMTTLWKNIFQKKQKSSPADDSEVFSSIYAPAEVKRGAHLLAQVYLHLYDETEQVKAHAQMADKNAEQRGYIPLSLNLKKGDNVDIEFHVDGETRLMSERKSITWRGSFTKCTFKYHVPKDIDIEELSCEANLFVNGALIGEMTFLTQIVESPRKLNTEILSHRFKKIFISYAHEDYSKVKFMAQAYKAQGVDYFLDRDYLKAGDIYPRKISDYINSADLFILCWSQNAAESDYVGLERSQALSIAKNTDPINGTLTIHPISITPRADLPDDMKDHYNFDKI